MSKNFELLQKLGKEQEIVHSSSSNGNNSVAPKPLVAASSGEIKEGLEEINSFVQQVFLASSDAPRRVLFTSTESGTGCTWVCSHTAEVLASRIAGSVCLVDANLREPGIHLQFGVENESGLSESLLHPDPIRSFVRTLSPNLFLISAGSSRDSALSLLASDRMRLRLTELRAEFDFVMVDLPPLSVANDAAILGPQSDGVVLVLKANASKKQTARQAVETLQAANAKVLGAVLNQRKFPIPESIYKRL